MTPVRAAAILAAALLTLADGPAQAETLPSAVTAVTVFADRAAVTRRIEPELQAGANTVTVEGLPATLLPESVRVDGSAAAAVQLGAVEVRARYGQGTSPEAERRLQQEIEALQDRRRALDDEIRAGQAQLDFIAALGREAPQVASEERAEGIIDPAVWEQAWNTVSAGTADALRRIREAQQSQRNIDRELEVKQREHALVASGGAAASIEVAVHLDAAAPGRAVLALSYQVPNASWIPLYEARLDSESGEVGLTQAGAVRQHTGEDWSDVVLTLSTARPALGAVVPELEPWFIRIGEPVDHLIEGQGAFRGNELKDLSASKSEPAAAPASDQPIAAGGATVAGSEFSAQYEIAGKASVPADGSSHRFPIAERKLSSTLSVTAAPRLASVGYLVALAKADGEEPLLPGPVSVFRDGSYVGLSQIELTPPGAELKLAFGADDRVKIDYRLVGDGESQEGLISTDRRIERQYRMAVANHHAQALEITVLDQIPVSQDERIEVELLKGTKPTHSDFDGRKGVLAWRYAYQPGETRVIEFGYAVTAPEDLPVAGLSGILGDPRIDANAPRP